MKIAILDLTSHPLPLLEGMPRVGQQIEAWLQPEMPQAELRSYDIEDGGEDLPALAEFDGLLVSGSEFGVYDNRPWMQPLRQLLLETKEAGKPIYGICFGHQIMADTFGGKAEKAKAGNVVGARRFANGVDAIDAYVWHQDQVTKVPPSARVTAKAEHCPVGALSYDFPAASVQFHPEYTEEHLRGIFDRADGAEGFPSSEQMSAAIQSFEGAQVNSVAVAVEAAAFFEKHALT